MEAQTDLKTYLDQGKQALAQGKGREAAIAYAHAAQMEPGNPLVHLGLAEANLALSSNDVVRMACQRTQELATSGPIYELAQALLELLNRRYEQSLQLTDSSLHDDPSNAYAHALRAYLLRATHQDYDAGLARGRASRLSFGGKFENCFPAVEPIYVNGYSGQPAAFTPQVPVQMVETQVQQPRTEQREQIPTWSRPGNMQRQAIRTRFWLNQHPRVLTYSLIGINVLMYLILALMSQSLTEISASVIVNMGAQVNYLVTQGEIWRLFTSMFLHFDITHIGFNMLSLFFVGSFAELLFGKRRFLIIYLVAGIVGSLVTYFWFGPQDITIAAGASGAIFGLFGALGAFYIINRRALGTSGNAMLGQWIFWLVLNLAFDLYQPGIGLQDHIGGLVTGLILGMIFLPPLRKRIRKA